MIYLIGLAISMILPTLVFVYTLNKSKRHRFRMGAIVGMVFYGIGVVVLLGVVVLTIVYLAFPNIEENPFIMWYVRAAGLEEFFKFLFVYLFFWKRNKLRYNWDIMVAMVATGWGFTLAENVEYVLMGSPLVTGIMRGLHFGHIDFSIIMGYFMIKAANAEAVDQKGKRTLYFFLSVFVAILYHGTYDFVLSETGGWALVFFGFFILMCIPLFLWLRSMMKDYWLLFPEHDPVMPQQMYQPMMQQAYPQNPMQPGMYGQQVTGQPMMQQAYPQNPMQPGMYGQPMNSQMYSQQMNPQMYMQQPMMNPQTYQPQNAQPVQPMMNPQMYGQQQTYQPQNAQPVQSQMNPQMYNQQMNPQQNPQMYQQPQAQQQAQPQAMPIQVETIQVLHK